VGWLPRLDERATCRVAARQSQLARQPTPVNDQLAPGIRRIRRSPRRHPPDRDPLGTAELRALRSKAACYVIRSHPRRITFGFA
jgi:hypothetical protein